MQERVYVAAVVIVAEQPMAGRASGPRYARRFTN